MITEKRQFARNIWTSWAGYGLRIVISFFFVPYITSVLGDARYGVWVIVFQTINYFALLDFGLEKALLRFVSKHLGQKRFEVINRVLNTAFTLYLLVGSAIILGTWLTATFLFGYFRIDDPQLLAEGRNALLIIGLYMGFRFYLLPFAGSLGGFQRFDISNGLHMLEDLLRTGLLVWLLSAGYGLGALAMAILGVSFVRQILAIVWLRHIHPEIDFRPGLSNKPTARELFNYSKITFGITLAWLVIFNTDAVLLGLLVSSSAAGIYAPGAQLMLYLRNGVNVIASPITTTVSEMESRDDWNGIRNLYMKGIRYTSYFSFMAACGVIIFARPFVALWLDPEFAEASEVMRVLAVSAAFFVPQIVGNAVLFGIDRHSTLLRVLVLEAAAKIALSLLLLPKYGLIGMAYAAAIPQLVLYVTIYPYRMSHTLKIPVATILMTSLRSGLAAMVVTVPLSVIMYNVLPPFGWGPLLIDISVVGVAGLAAGWFVLAPEDRSRVKRVLAGRTRL